MVCAWGLCFGPLSIGLLIPSQTLGNASLSTVYVNKFFEVRQHEQPVKYVFSGDQRVATVTGSMSDSQRVQRLRLHPGWNLRSLAVQGSTLPFDGVDAGSDGIVAAYRLDPVTEQWLAVTPTETLSAGTILWLYAHGHPTIGLRGSFDEASDVTVPAGKAFLGTGGLESRGAPSAEPGVEIWSYDGVGKSWEVQAAGLPEGGDEVTSVLAPGEAIFLSNTIPIEWAAPDAGLAVRFSHPDHLRCVAVVTDAAGEVVEETAFHPFGPVRNEQRWRPVEEAYKYTQKERDQESGLHYFEARYLAASLARFSRPDTKYATLDSLAKQDMDSLLANPQSLNPYAYVRNNPIKFIDPQGEDAVKPRTDQGSYILTLKTAGGEPLDLPIASASVGGEMQRPGSGNSRRDQRRDSPVELHITRQADRQSTEHLKDYASSKVFEEATVTIRSPGKSSEELFKIRLTDASITSIVIGSGYGGSQTESLVISGTLPSPPKPAAPAAPAQPQATRAGNPFAPPPAFDVDKAAKQTARDFQEILSGTKSK